MKRGQIFSIPPNYSQLDNVQSVTFVTVNRDRISSVTGIQESSRHINIYLRITRVCESIPEETRGSRVTVNRFGNCQCDNVVEKSAAIPYVPRNVI